MTASATVTTDLLGYVHFLLESTNGCEVFPLADGGVQFRFTTDRGAIDAEFDTEGDIVMMIEDRGERSAGFAAQLWPDVVRFVQGQP